MTANYRSEDYGVLAEEEAVESGLNQIKMALSDENSAPALLEFVAEEVGVG